MRSSELCWAPTEGSSLRLFSSNDYMASQPTLQSAGLLQMQRCGMAWVTVLQPCDAPGACVKT